MGEAPIHNIEIEQALLGSIFLNNQAFDFVDGLRPEHFYEPIHQRIFEGCRALFQAGKPASPITLKDFLPGDIKIADLTISQYLARLAAAATSVINAKDYAEMLRHLAMIRDTQSVLVDLGRYQERVTFPGEALKDAWQRLDDIRMDQPQRHNVIESIGQSGTHFVDRMAGIMSGEIDAGGIPTGLADLDLLIGGLKPGDLVLGAGRPGMGKSTLAVVVARNIARAGLGVGYLSLEMSRDQTMSRFLCDEAYDDGGTPVEYRDLLHPKRLSMPAAERIVTAWDRVDKLPIMIDYSSNLTIGEIAAKARAMKLALKRKFDVPLKLLVVDYLKMVKASDRYRGQRTYEVGEISIGLKQFAKDEDLAVLLLAQLNRDVEKTEDKIPSLEHLRDSGDLEADADLVVFLFRRAYYIQNHPKISSDIAMQTELQQCFNTLMLIIAKQRSGPTGNVTLFCHMGASAIRCLAQPQEIPIL